MNKIDGDKIQKGTLYSNLSWQNSYLLYSKIILRGILNRIKKEDRGNIVHKLETERDARPNITLNS